MIIDFKGSLFRDNQRTDAPVGGRPLINDSLYDQTIYMNRQPEDYSQVLSYIKKSPETLAIFNAIATDISSDGVYFIPYKKQGKKGNIEKAEEFYLKSFFKSEFKAGIIDWLMFGNVAWWQGLTKADVKEYCKEKLKINFKESFFDEDTSLKAFKHVAWSTMYIMHDETSITYFKQTVGVGEGPIVDEFGSEIPGKRNAVGHHERLWKPESIIHGKFMNFDGKVYGYTPTFSLLPVISTQILLKDYLGNFFENGGVPDWMFILPEEMANSPNVQKLEQMLQEYKRSVSKHGNMVIPGNVKAEALNKFDKDMEFRALAIYYTAVLAFAFNMPMGRLQSILGMENKSKESSIADESYWRTISEAQDYHENLLNSQFWIPTFGVEMRFKKTYKQDEIRESQNLLFKQNFIQGMNGILAQHDKTLTSDFIIRYINGAQMDMRDSDFEKMKNPPTQGAQNNQDFMTNESLTEGNQQNRNEKRAQQEQSKERKKMM